MSVVRGRFFIRDLPLQWILSWPVWIDQLTAMADSNLPRPAKTALAADDTSDTTIKKRRLRCLESRRLKMELKRRHIESLQHELTRRTTTSYDTNTLPALSTSSVIESTPESSPSSSSIVVSLPKSARQSARKMAKDPAAATQVISRNFWKKKFNQQAWNGNEFESGF